MKNQSASLLTLVLFAALLPAQDSGKAGPASLYPPGTVSGVPNKDVTQANIAKNICSKKWSTKLIRPPASYTTALKKKQMQDWKLKGKTGDFEEDHFISLENGGDPKDPANLWPESYKTKIGKQTMGAKQKDLVESYIHDEICFDVPNHKVNSGKKYTAKAGVTLARGQEILATDWYGCYVKMVAGKPCD